MPDMLIIYDGECPVCRRARDWVAARVPGDRVEFIACQSEERAARAPQVSPEACMEAMQLVMHDGAVYAGAAALPPILRMTRRWRWLAVLLQAPLVRRGLPVLYRWVARNRGALSGFLGRHGRAGPCDKNGGCPR